MLKRGFTERGDTLIEVMFATAVLAFLIVLSISIMNKGTLQSERAVEGTFVRQALDSQTELLRYARDAYVNNDVGGPDLWNAIKNRRVSTGSVMPFSNLATSNCLPPTSQAFWLETSGSKVVLQPSFSKPVTYAAPGNGIWITAASTGANTNYLDFYLYACWNSSTGENATSGTVVRLYEPVS